MKLTAYIWIWPILMGAALCAAEEVINSDDSRDESDEVEASITFSMEPTFRNICIAAIGEENGKQALQKIVTAEETFTKCRQNFVESMIMGAQRSSSDAEFQLTQAIIKYICDNRKVPLNCLADLLTSLHPCLKVKDKETLTTFVNTVERLLEFGCQNEDHIIRIFNDESTKMCFASQIDNIDACRYPLFSNNSDDDDGEDILVLREKDCNELGSFEDCCLSHLKSCLPETSTNLVVSVLHIFRNNMCHILPPLPVPGNANITLV